MKKRLLWSIGIMFVIIFGMSVWILSNKETTKPTPLSEELPMYALSKALFEYNVFMVRYKDAQFLTYEQAQKQAYEQLLTQAAFTYAAEQQHITIDRQAVDEAIRQQKIKRQQALSDGNYRYYLFEQTVASHFSNDEALHKKNALQQQVALQVAQAAGENVSQMSQISTKLQQVTVQQYKETFSEEVQKFETDYQLTEKVQLLPYTEIAATNDFSIGDKVRIGADDEGYAVVHEASSPQQFITTYYPEAFEQLQQTEPLLDVFSPLSLVSYRQRAATQYTTTNDEQFKALYEYFVLLQNRYRTSYTELNLPLIENPQVAVTQHQHNERGQSSYTLQLIFERQKPLTEPFTIKGLAQLQNFNLVAERVEKRQKMNVFYTQYVLTIQTNYVTVTDQQAKEIEQHPAILIQYQNYAGQQVEQRIE